jgi:hypothetical protein
MTDDFITLFEKLFCEPILWDALEDARCSGRVMAMGERMKQTGWLW